MEKTAIVLKHKLVLVLVYRISIITNVNVTKLLNNILIVIVDVGFHCFIIHCCTQVGNSFQLLIIILSELIMCSRIYKIKNIKKMIK